MYYIYTSFIKNKLQYLYYFESDKIEEGYAIIKKRIFTLSIHKTYITDIGEKIFLGSKPYKVESIGDGIAAIVMCLFEQNLADELVINDFLEMDKM